jgi:Chromo (CHRromatin Organisation MOdifier) domain
VAYKLELPHQWTIHPVFHTSLLTPYVETKEHGPNYSRLPPNLIGGEEQYKVKTIQSHQHCRHTRQLQYLLKWKGYPESDNMWEPAAQVHSPELIKQYHCRNPLDNIKVALLS